jgi:hypothetical protein
LLHSKLTLQIHAKHVNCKIKHIVERSRYLQKYLSSTGQYLYHYIYVINNNDSWTWMLCCQSLNIVRSYRSYRDLSFIIAVVPLCHCAIETIIYYCSDGFFLNFIQISCRFSCQCHELNSPSACNYFYWFLSERILLFIYLFISD